MKVLSLAAKMSNKFFSHLHHLRIFMNLANHLFQFFHAWFFAFHNVTMEKQIYKTFEGVADE